MIEQIQLAMKKYCKLEHGKTILVAISGGPDSLCLMDALWLLGYPLVVAHLDHSLRPESSTDALEVQRMAQERDLNWVTGREDVAAFAQARHMSIEEAARVVRYRFLFTHAEKFQVQAVAVGHTADDQVETVLMHLLRGAGISGLSGMKYRSLPHTWNQHIPLVRPLLGTWRNQITAHLQERGLVALHDQSNQDTRFYRNRLRHELLPGLEAMTPGIRQRIWQTANILQSEETALQALEDQAWAANCQENCPGCLAFDLIGLRAQPLAIQRRLLRRGIAHLRHNLRDIDYAAIERGLEFLSVPTNTHKMDLIAGLRLELEGTRLWLATWEADLPGANWPQLSPGEEFFLEAPGEAILKSGWKLRAEVLPANPATLEQAYSEPDPYRAWLDLERLRLPLHVRSRCPGDRFRPLGMENHTLKLSDFMINLKLPHRARSAWPLLLSEGEIAWLPGYRSSQALAVRQTSTKLVRLSLTRDSETSLEV